MKAIILKKTGKPHVLAPETVPDPAPAAGEVLVEMAYAGINYAEILSRKGLYGWAIKRPYILGMEGSGVISAVGDGVDSNRVGEKVVVGTQYGCYAEKIALPAERAIPAVDHFSMAENAAFVVNYMTAWISLNQMAKLQKGETLLITAAAGGVGTAAVQIASKMGAKVYGLAGSQEKIDFLKELGATDAFNYRESDCFEKLKAATGGLDVVLEMVGGDVFKQAYAMLNPFGRLTLAGFASLDLKKWNPFSWWKTWRDIPRANFSDLAHKSVAVMASHIGYLLDDPERMMAIYNDLAAFVTRHKIRPIIGKTFPFDAVADAHTFIESRKSIGKVLLAHDSAESRKGT